MMDRLVPFGVALLVFAMGYASMYFATIATDQWIVLRITLFGLGVILSAQSGSLLCYAFGNGRGR